MKFKTLFKRLSFLTIPAWLVPALMLVLLAGVVQAATAGLPFTEDFADTNLQDPLLTTANWSTDEQALLLAWRQRQYGAFGSGLAGSDITTDTDDNSSVALGDVDGDGDLDLVAGNWNQANRLYLNNGTAAPFNGVSGSDITSDAHYTRSVALGDVDGDGDLDLVAGNEGQANRLYLNNGDGTFAGGSDITTDADDTWSVTLGDVDGDGDLDLVAGNYGQANRLYLNNSTATPFDGVSGSNITSDADSTISVALGDVDGDGDLDLVAGNYSSQTNRLYLNNGTADPFAGVSGSNITSDADPTSSVALGDVDGDGDLDLVAGNNSQPNRLYLNNGTANPFNGVSGSDITSDAHYTRSVALGDVDGDGDLDLVAGNYSSQTNRLYLNNGTAAPFNGVSGSDITSDAHWTWSVALGDVDGDGDLDLVAGNNGQANRLYLNNGDGTFASSSITGDAHNTYSVALGDVDGDGDLDLVAGNDVPANRLYLNNGAATPFHPVSGSNITANTDDTQSVTLGDVDGDGDLDLVAGNENQANRLYLNNGTTNPFAGVSGSNITSDAHETTSVALGDVDGDGDLDLVAGNYNAQTNRLYLNNGTTTPFNSVTGSNITTDTHWTTSVALGDVDRDGHLDLVAGNDGQANRLYLNNGTTDPFSGVSGSDITTDTHKTISVALGDVDRDGDLDLVAGNWWQVNRLYLNNGDGTFASGVDITSDADPTWSVTLGDVDRDGDLDLVAGNWSQPNRLYLNNGDGTFASSSDITSDANATNAVVLMDMDRDGDLDLVAGNTEGQPNRLYLNNGTATPFNGVTGSDITADAHDTKSVAVGDVDGNGDLDLVAGNYGQANRLYRRLLYHTGQGQAGSLRVDTETSNIDNATLTHVATLPPNTGVTYWLSNNGGARWFIVRPGVNFVFPTSGTDLRWRAELRSLSPVRTPWIEQLTIGGGALDIYLPLIFKNSQ